MAAGNGASDSDADFFDSSPGLALTTAPDPLGGLPAALRTSIGGCLGVLWFRGSHRETLPSVTDIGVGDGRSAADLRNGLQHRA